MSNLGRTFQQLYLIDISSFIFRAFYAVRELTAPDGTPVNAVYGVASMLRKLIDEVKPQYLAVVYDSKEPSFRKEIYSEYKANRSATPEALIPQFDLIEQLISKMGIPSFRQSGIEADDLIATLNRKWLESDPRHRVVVVSGDKDLMALVSAKTQVWDTMKDVHYTEHEVYQKFGVHPQQVRDYLAMVGDTSDNIPGISGIGPKGAEILLREYGTLEQVIAAAKAGKISGKKGQIIVEEETMARLSQELATLIENLEIEVAPEMARFQDRPGADLKQFYEKMNFKSLAKKLDDQKAPSAEQRASEIIPTIEMPVERSLNFVTIWDEPSLKSCIEMIRRSGIFAFDTETTSLDPRSAELVGISVAIPKLDGDPNRIPDGVYIPVGHVTTLEQSMQNPESAGRQQMDRERVLERLRPILEDSHIRKVGQNVKYDYRVMLHQGVKMQGIFADTMMAAYVLDSGGRHNLDFLAQKYLHHSMLSYEEVTGKGAKQITFDQVPIELATQYSAEDAWATLSLWKTLEPKLRESKSEQLFRDIDLPLVQVVAEMEETGIRIDVPFLQKLERQFEEELQLIEKKILSYSKNPNLNLNSPKQLAVFLFEELKLPTQSKTKTGFSTDASVLEAIANRHEAPRLLLEYREISKLQGTYVKPLQELRDPVDHRIRTSFHLTGTATGRLSSSDPNLQNIPTRSQRGQKIREAFISSPNCVLISADYSQIELRILAHLSEDAVLMESFQKNQDVHRRTAGEIYHVDPSVTTDEQRAVAKAINFGLMYGKTPFGLAEELGISRGQAKEMIDRYFTRYSGVKQFLQNQVQQAHERKYVSTLLGRKRFLPELESKNPGVRANAERMAMNSPIQGTASDLIKVAMIRIHNEIRQYDARLLLQIHDELLVECPSDQLGRVSECMVRIMEGALALKVPLKVNLNHGLRWSDL